MPTKQPYPTYIVYYPTNHNDDSERFSTLEEAIAYVQKGGTYGTVLKLETVYDEDDK